jgi:outer membrane biosynthesis protein TonB
MRAGEVMMFLVFNAGVIFGLHHWQMRLMTKKLERAKHEIQELEDLVVAIIEELSEFVAVEPNTTKPELEAQSKPHLHQASPSEVKPEVTPAQQSMVKLTLTSEPAPEVRPETTSAQQPRVKAKAIPEPPPEVTSAQELEIKSELIPPPKPKPKAKAKGKSIKPTPTALTSDSPVSSPTNAVAVNPVAKLSLPLDGRVSDSKHQKVLNLAHQGMEVAEIAKQLKMGQGEIQLILGLYK